MKRGWRVMALLCLGILVPATGAVRGQSAGSIVGWGTQVVVEQSALEGLVVVAAGHEHSLGLRSNRTIVAWGSNYYGQCNVPAPNANFAAVAGAYDRSLGLRGSPQSAVYDPEFGGTSGTDMLRILSVAPNPFAMSAQISFEAQVSGSVSMEVHDVGGRHVTTAALGSLGPGRHRVSWDARDATGVRVASGIYFLWLRGVAGDSRAVRVLLVP